MADDATERTVGAYYGSWGLVGAIEGALCSAGLDPARVTVEQFAPLDNFHTFGAAGTLELARRAGIAAGKRVLDVDGGVVGGPARLLAGRFGCDVTVLDLTPEFCRTGEALTAWTRLTERVAFVCGSARPALPRRRLRRRLDPTRRDEPRRQAVHVCRDPPCCGPVGASRSST